MTINTRLRAVLEALGMNTRAFALQAGIDPAVLHNIVSEKGRQSKPSFDILEKILLSFDNISSEYLMRGSGPILDSQDQEKGVRIDPKKGGQDWGQDSPYIKNDLYIKSDQKASLYRSGEDLQAGVSQEKPDLSLSDVERAGYSDLKDLLKRSISTQETVMIAIMSRLEALERRLIDPDQAELP